MEYREQEDIQEEYLSLAEDVKVVKNTAAMSARAIVEVLDRLRVPTPLYTKAMEIFNEDTISTVSADVWEDFWGQVCDSQMDSLELMHILVKALTCATFDHHIWKRIPEYVMDNVEDTDLIAYVKAHIAPEYVIKNAPIAIQKALKESIVTRDFYELYSCISLFYGLAKEVFFVSSEELDGLFTAQGAWGKDIAAYLQTISQESESIDFCTKFLYLMSDTPPVRELAITIISPQLADIVAQALREGKDTREFFALLPFPPMLIETPQVQDAVLWKLEGYIRNGQYDYIISNNYSPDGHGLLVTYPLPTECIQNNERIQEVLVTTLREYILQGRVEVAYRVLENKLLVERLGYDSQELWLIVQKDATFVEGILQSDADTLWKILGKEAFPLLEEYIWKMSSKFLSENIHRGFNILMSYFDADIDKVEKVFVQALDMAVADGDLSLFHSALHYRFYADYSTPWNGIVRNIDVYMRNSFQDIDPQLLQDIIKNNFGRYVKEGRDLYGYVLRELYAPFLTKEEMRGLATSVLQEELQNGSLTLWLRIANSSELTNLEINMELLLASVSEEKIYQMVVKLDYKDFEKFVLKIKSFQHNFDELNDRLSKYMRVRQLIITAAIPEINHIQENLLEELTKVENPEELFKYIEAIYLKNHLPEFAKRFEVFKVLYPKETIEKHIYLHTSPVLQAAGSRRRMEILFQDLLKSHLASADSNLMMYLLFLRDQGELLDRVHTDFDSLTEEEYRQVQVLIETYQTILFASSRGTKAISSEINISEMLVELFAQFGVRSGQSLADRCVELFARPLGMHSIDDLLSYMETCRVSAHQENIAYVEKTVGHIEIHEGDFLKNAPSKFIESIIDDGFLAREFLGASSDSDATPFDIDLLRIPKLLQGEELETYVKENEYGNLSFLIRAGEDVEDTTDQQVKFTKRTPESRLLYEAFRTGVVSDEHYGIRTSIPNTKFAAIFMSANALADKKILEDLAIAIAKKNLYIPVADSQGNVLFAPKDFAQYRGVLQGIPLYSEEPVEIAKSDFSQQSEHALSPDLYMQEQQEIFIKSIAELLEKHGVSTCIDAQDRRLDHAVLQDIGSTSRGTNLPGDFDFDYALHIPARLFHDAKGFGALCDDLFALFGKPDVQHSKVNATQLRFLGSTGLGEQPLDIDLAIYSTNAAIPFATHEAIATKLESIRTHDGEEVYESVLQEIRNAKTLLKRYKTYKKSADPRDPTSTGGGLGGVGVEYLILNYGGTVRSAFRAFYKAAHLPTGERKNFATFQDSFLLVDPGINLRTNHHDNFLRSNLTEEKYDIMLDMIAKEFPDIV